MEVGGYLCSGLDSATNILGALGVVTHLPSLSFFLWQMRGLDHITAFQSVVPNMKCFSLVYKYILLNGYIGFLKICVWENYDWLIKLMIILVLLIDVAKVSSNIRPE